MAITKTGRTLTASTSVAAGATQTSGALNLTTTGGIKLTVRITNGATPPTTPCICYVEISTVEGFTNPFIIGQMSGGVTASTVIEAPFDVDARVMYVRTRFTGHTGQAVTVESHGHELTTPN